MTAGTTMTMSINRLSSRESYRLDPSDTQSDHSPLDDVESTIYYFLNIIATVISKALSAKTVFLVGMEAKLEAWAVQWEECEWKANESELKADKEVQAARSSIWDVDEAMIQMVTRFLQTDDYAYRHKYAKVVFEARSTSTLELDSRGEFVPSILRDIYRRLERLGSTLTREYGLTCNSESTDLSEETLQSYRENLWNSGFIMKAAKEWIYIVAGDEGASALLEALDGISQWRDRNEFNNLWEDLYRSKSGEGPMEWEGHSARVERKCAELRAIFIKLRESANPFLDRIWITDVLKV